MFQELCKYPLICEKMIIKAFKLPFLKQVLRMNLETAEKWIKKN